MLQAKRNKNASLQSRDLRARAPDLGPRRSWTAAPSRSLSAAPSNNRHIRMVPHALAVTVRAPTAAAAAAEATALDPANEPAYDPGCEANELLRLVSARSWPRLSKSNGEAAGVDIIATISEQKTS